MFDKLAEYRGKSQRNLDAKMIDGKQCDGFEIGLREIDPDASEGTLTLWVGADSQLPVEAEVRVETPILMVMRMTDFVWNREFDDALFDTSPPEGYQDISKPADPIDTQVKQITEALELYAKLSGGRYPQVKTVYGDVIRDQMQEMAGFKGKPDVKWFQDKNFQQITNATQGFARITVLQRNNPDAKYFGQDVGPKDAEKILLYWQLPDGKYQVIYGDLRSESLTSEKLKS
jgi:hypothetical protein